MNSIKEGLSIALALVLYPLFYVGILMLVGCLWIYEQIGGAYEWSCGKLRIRP